MINIRDEKYIKAFGTHLRTLREARNISQHQLGLDAGIDKNQVGNMERGEINPSISTIKVIAEALGIKPKDLLDF